MILRYYKRLKLKNVKYQSKIFFPLQLNYILLLFGLKVCKQVSYHWEIAGSIPTIRGHSVWVGGTACSFSPVNHQAIVCMCELMYKKEGVQRFAPIVLPLHEQQVKKTWMAGFTCLIRSCRVQQNRACLKSENQQAIQKDLCSSYDSYYHLNSGPVCTFAVQFIQFIVIITDPLWADKQDMLYICIRFRGSLSTVQLTPEDSEKNTALQAPLPPRPSPPLEHQEEALHLMTG